MRSRTWLIATFQGKKCISAETVSGSAHYISRLVEICHLIKTVTNTKDLQSWTVELTRSDLEKDTDTKAPDSWHNTLHDREIEIFERAYQASYNGVK